MIIHKKEPGSSEELKKKNEITEFTADVIRRIEYISKFIDGPIESLSVCKLTGEKRRIVISFDVISDDAAKEYHKAMMEKLERNKASMFVDKNFDARVGVKSE